jgi:hypothetical protein
MVVEVGDDELTSTGQRDVVRTSQLRRVEAPRPEPADDFPRLRAEHHDARAFVVHGDYPPFCVGCHSFRAWNGQQQKETTNLAIFWICKRPIKNY